MASFDFIDAATKGYRFLWEERLTVARLGFPLLVFKFVSYVAVLALSLEANILRQGLVYLPAYFVEGWLLAQMIRLYCFGERWPVARTENNGELIAARIRTIKAAIGIFVLTKLCLSVLMAVFIMGAPATGTEVPQPNAAAFAGAMVALAMMLWAFRLLWLYVPAAMGYGVGEFLYRARGYMTSIYMIGAWFICFLPPAMVALMFSEALASLAGEGGASFLRFVMIGMQSVFEIMISVIASVAMAQAVRAIFTGDDRDEDKGKY